METKEFKPCSCPSLARSNFQFVMQWGGTQKNLTFCWVKASIRERTLEICRGILSNLCLRTDLYMWEERKGTTGENIGSLTSEAHIRLRIFLEPHKSEWKDIKLPGALGRVVTTYYLSNGSILPLHRRHLYSFLNKA